MNRLVEIVSAIATLAEKMFYRTIRILLGVALFVLGLWAGSEFIDLAAIPLREYSLKTIGLLVFFGWLAVAGIMWAFKMAFGAPFIDSKADNG